MILVDTSVIVAWLDRTHKHHRECLQAIFEFAASDELAVSSVTFSELAVGRRTREAVDEDLHLFTRLDLGFNAAWRAGIAFRQQRPAKADTVVLPHFYIRAQAATMGIRHLTNDRRRLLVWPDVEFVFPSA